MTSLTPSEDREALFRGCNNLVGKGVSRKLSSALSSRDPSTIPPEWEEVIARLCSAIKKVEKGTTGDPTICVQLLWLNTFITAPEKLPEREPSEKMRLSLAWIVRLIENGVKNGESHLRYDRGEFVRHNRRQLERAEKAKAAEKRIARKAASTSTETTATSAKAEPKDDLVVAFNGTDPKAAPLVKTLSNKIAEVAKTTVKVVAPTLAESSTTSLGQKSQGGINDLKKGSSEVQSQVLEVDSDSPFIPAFSSRDESAFNSGSGKSDSGDFDDIHSGPRASIKAASNHPESGSAVSSTDAEERTSSSAVSAKKTSINQPRRKHVELSNTLLLEMTKSEQTIIATLATQLIAIIKVRRSSRVLSPVVRAGQLLEAGNETPRAHQIPRPEYLLRMAIEIANVRMSAHLKSDDMKKWFAENRKVWQQVNNKGRQSAEITNLGSTDKPAMSQDAELSTSAVHTEPLQTEHVRPDPETPPLPLSNRGKKKLKTLTPRNRPSTRPARAVRVPKRSTRAVVSRSARTTSTKVEHDTASAPPVEVPAAQFDAALQSVDQAEEINRLYRPGPRRPEEASSSSSTPPPGYEAVAKRERRIREARAAQNAATARCASDAVRCEVEGVC